MDSSNSIVFFKSEKSNDSYRSLFSQNGFNVTFEPVLDFDFVNKAELLQLLLGSDGAPCDAIVATSSRSLEAIFLALSDSDAKMQQAIRDLWKTRTLFVVAENTRSACPMEFAKVYSGETDASQLCTVISEAYPTAKANDGEPWRLLFLCSNIRRDVLPDFFGSDGQHKHIQLVELTVYSTRKLNISSQLGDEASEWWAFFSPSGVDAVLSSLKNGHQSNSNGLPEGIKVASIGKTTAEALKSAGIVADAVASTPSPEGLLECIKSHNCSSTM